MKSNRELLESSLNETSFSAVGSRTPGSRTNPILAGYVKASPELAGAFIGSRMNEIEAFAQYHGYDRNMLKEIANEAIHTGRVPDLSSRLPDTYDKATIARFISDVMLGIGEQRELPVMPEGDKSGTYGPGSTTSLTSKTQKDFEDEQEESFFARFGFDRLEGESRTTDDDFLEESALAGLMDLTGSKAGAGVSRDLHSTYVGHDLSAISTGGRKYREIYLQPNHIYFMNEQGEDKLILVTEVRDTGVRFYGDAFRVERCMNRSEMNDRIFRGTEAYMETQAARCHPRLVEAFEGMMNRKRSNLRHLLDDCRRVRVTVSKADSFSNRDLYHDAAQYGIVEEVEGGYEILIERAKIPYIKRSRLFVVKNIEERLEGLGCVLGEEKKHYENQLNESWEEDRAPASLVEDFTGNPDAINDVFGEAINVMWQNSFGPNKDFDDEDPDSGDEGDSSVDDGDALDVDDQYEARLQEGLAPSREKGLIVREQAFKKAREFAAKAQSNQNKWVWGESGEEDLARSQSLMAAVRQSEDWWAHHYHQYLWCCDEALVNKLSEGVSADDPSKGQEVEEMDFKDSIRELKAKKKSGKKLSAWEKKVVKDLKKTGDAHDALRGKRKSYAPRRMSKDFEEDMQYQHVRVNDPKEFKRIRTVTFGKGIKARIGFKKGESSKVVSVLFPKDKYSIDQAKEWAKKHAYKIVKSMSASGKTENFDKLEKGAVIEAYSASIAGSIVEVRGDLAKVEWSGDYDGPNIVHMSRLRLAGKSGKNALPQPHLEGEDLDEKRLTYRERENLPASAFVFPKERKYPIPDLAHARNALARVSQHGTSEEKKKVRAEVRKRFPQIDVEENYEPEDPFMDTLLEHPAYAGNTFQQAMEIMEHKSDGGFKSPLFDLEERVIYDKDPGIRDPRIDNGDGMFGTEAREGEFFSESEDPFNSFSNEFWGVGGVADTLGS